MASDHTPRRVVCLQPSATVILAALGRLDRVVACTRYCADVCPEVKNGGRSIIADSWTAQSRQIMAARPDLVIAAVPYQEQAVVEILKAGVRFLGLAPKALADIYTDIATIAGVVGAGRRGESVIADMQREIETLRARVTSTARPRVFCEEWANREDSRQRSRFWPMPRKSSLLRGAGPGTACPCRRLFTSGDGRRCLRCGPEGCTASAMSF